MKRIFRLSSMLRLTLLFLITFAFQSCSEQKIKESTDETQNITEYLRANSDYSMFLEILDITNYASFMNTYGTYTLFLPTNDAVQAYLDELGVSSLSEVPLEDLQDLAKLHILDQKVNTTSFTDGKIATPSMYGQYLITGATNENGVSSITVNRTSKIVISNIEVGNGVIHVIDKVLKVVKKTLAQTIEEDPNLSLFTEVLKATGWFDKLNLPITYDANNVASYLTVLAQTNEVYDNTTWTPPGATTPITLNTLDNLKLRYSHLGDPTNAADSLNLYVSYRIVPGLQYLADIAIAQTLETKAPLEVISAKLDGQDILLNEDVFNGVLEEGVSMNRTLSDVTCSNGVLHYVNGNFSIKKRNPTPVYFDLADQPEFRKQTAIFRKHLGLTISLLQDAMTDVTWEGANAVTYTDPKPGGSTSGGWHGDLFEIYRFRTGYIQNIQFKTPVIIKGRYKVWVNYRPQSTKTPLVKVYFNDVELPRQVSFLEYTKLSSAPTIEEERVQESLGYKMPVTPRDGNINSRLCGVIDVPTTGRHTIKFESLTSGTGAQTWIDVVEFRPIDMDQLDPQLQKAGDGIIFRP